MRRALVPKGVGYAAWLENALRFGNKRIGFGEVTGSLCEAICPMRIDLGVA
jgi:hypothetical protein